MKKVHKYLSGFIIGVINSLIGACGGIITVAVLKKDGMDQTSAHANAVAIILPLTVISAVFYGLNGYVSLEESLLFIPGGIIGAILGGLSLTKIPKKLLKNIFALFIIWAGIRMIIR